jgi:predicted Zn-dependent peptidase
VIEVLNTILGGSFTSRLNSNLREQHGYAYGASSGFAMPATPGPFQASAAVQTDKTAEALREFFKEFDGIRQPVPADELNKARNNVALGFPGTFETTGSMAGHMQEMIVYNLPETYFNGYVSRVQDVTSGDLQRAAQQYIQPDKFAVVVVGDLAKIEKPIRDLNLAPVKTLTLDELFK